MGDESLTEETVRGDGHFEEETQEQLNTAMKRLEDLVRPDGSVVSFGKQELSLLKEIIQSVTEKHREEMIWRFCSFIDEEEAHNHIAAYYEAKDLGMDTGFNVAYAFSLCSTNRKGGYTNNLTAMVLDTLQHGKWASSQQGRRVRIGSGNPRSPIPD